uniref:Uncharacterized protein n=1 Tax=Leishmania guyanensis TaxID=5670 RepID=A0A1E1IWF7_LEIGU|nr:Hypothetical protein BN36_2231200 [Leishmania guyanensis]
MKAIFIQKKCCSFLFRYYVPEFYGAAHLFPQLYHSTLLTLLYYLPLSSWFPTSASVNYSPSCKRCGAANM